MPLLTLSLLVSCNNGGGEGEQVEFMLSSEQPTKVEGKVATVYVDWQPDGHQIKFNSFTFVTQSGEEITPSFDQKDDPRPLPVTITFNSDITEEINGTLSFAYEDRTAKTQGENSIDITIKPEKKYFDVSTSGEHIHYYKDSGLEVPLDIVKVKKNEDFVFYMFGEENTNENSESYIPPTSLTIKINDKVEDDCYSIEPVSGEYENLLKKVTINANYVVGDIAIQGDGVHEDYYQMRFPYLIGLRKPEIQDTFFEYDSEATFEFYAANDSNENDELLTAENVFVNLDGRGKEWIAPSTSSSDDVTFEHDTVNDKYYLHIKGNTITSATTNVINVVARAKSVSILNSTNWNEINRASGRGYATALFDIGDTKDIVINRVIYQVRIIDFNKDNLSSDLSKQAGITFEFANIISNFETRWGDDVNNNRNYIEHSDLNKCLQEEGAIYKRIPPDLMSVIKQVDKVVDIYQNDKWQDGHYDTKLFPLSVGEINGDLSTSYQYYKGADDDKRKKGAAGSGQFTAYWLRSPELSSVTRNIGLMVKNNGSVWHNYVDTPYAVAPAFCV